MKRRGEEDEEEEKESREGKEKKKKDVGCLSLRPCVTEMGVGERVAVIIAREAAVAHVGEATHNGRGLLPCRPELRLFSPLFSLFYFIDGPKSVGRFELFASPLFRKTLALGPELPMSVSKRAGKAGEYLERCAFVCGLRFDLREPLVCVWERAGSSTWSGL